MKVIVRALRSHTYAGKLRKADREYEAAKSDLRLLKALGWAEAVETAAATYQTRVMVAEPAVKPKRKYTKRKKAA